MIFDRAFKYQVMGLLYLILGKLTAVGLALPLFIIGLVYIVMSIYWSWKERYL